MKRFVLKAEHVLLCMTLGYRVTSVDVHDAWSVWRSHTKPTHKSLILFDELDRTVQVLDEPYRDAIRDVAKEMGFDGPVPAVR